MPIFQATAAGGATQFDGLTAATGLFDAATHTGSPTIQVRVNSISFHTGGAITSWTLTMNDPGQASHTTLLLTDTTADLACGGPGGFMVLPTNADSNAWQLAFVTVGMAATGTIKIDYDFETTEG